MGVEEWGWARAPVLVLVTAVVGVVASTATLSTSAAARPASSTKRVFGTFPYYQADLYPPSKVDFSRLTHVSTGNVWPENGGCCRPASGDVGAGEKFARDMNRRAHKHRVKTLLLVGGSDSQASAWLHNTETRAASDAFARATKEYAQRLGYDGIDFDWETGIRADRAARYAASLRSVWPDAVVSFDTGPYDFVGAREVSRYVDIVNVMTYIPPGHWDGWDGPWYLSPLHGDAVGHPYSIDHAVKAVEKLGVPAAEINIGVGFFADGWSDTSPVDGKCPTGPIGFAGENYGPTVSDNDLPLSKVYSDYLPMMIRHWDAVAQVAYLSAPSSALGGQRPAGVGSPKLCYISYDDQQSFAAKGDYVKMRELGGVVIWTVPQGYSRAKQTNDPLVWMSEAVK